MIDTLINGRWTLALPEHRAARPEWVTGWEKERLASMALNLAPGDLIIDVGAEEGDMPALYASWGCDVVLVEPNPLVWPNIRAIWNANNLPGPRSWFVGFAGADERHVPGWVHNTPEGDGWPECAHGPIIGDHGFLNLAERTDVPTQPLDGLHVAGEVAAITIDVEGAELEVLKGATRILVADRPLLWVSIHPLFMRQMYDQHAVDLHAFLDTFGYDGHHLAAAHEEHWLFIPR